MDTQDIVLFVSFLATLLCGFFIGCKYQEIALALKQVKSPEKNSVDNPTPAEHIALQDIMPGIKSDNLVVPTRSNVAKSKVMHYPSPEIIRKRHEKENEERYAASSSEKRESGTYVI